MNRLDGTLDGLLHLMDRQVIDCDGLLVCKVDDVELAAYDDGGVGVTGFLAGSAVLIPRLGRIGGWLLTLWLEMGAQRAGREIPWRIDLMDVDSVDSAVHLRIPRDGALVRELAADRGAGRRRLSELIGADVAGPDGSLGHVLDVRLEAGAGPAPTLVALIVGRGRPGTMLGYDRRGDQGPWLVRHVVRWMHRHSGLVAAGGIEEIDWEAGRVRVSGALEPLDPARK